MTTGSSRTLTPRVGGMTCRHCVRDVTARLRDVPGVETVAAVLAALGGGDTVEVVRARPGAGTGPPETEATWRA